MREILTKNELDNHIDFLKRTILDLDICIYNIEAIIKASRNESNVRVISNYLSHYVYLTYAYSSIIIYKIFSPKEKRSFSKLINKLENFKYDSELSGFLKSNEAKEESYLFSTRNQIIESTQILNVKINEKAEVLKKVFDRRNTFYAHNDPDKKYPVENLQDLKEIQKLTKQIFKTLYSGFYGSTYLFIKHYWSIDSVLEQSKFIDNYYKGIEASIGNT